MASQFKLVIRTLSSGAEQVAAAAAAGAARRAVLADLAPVLGGRQHQARGLDVSAVQDNEGWNVYIVDTSIGASTTPTPALA